MPISVASVRRAALQLSKVEKAVTFKNLKDLLQASGRDLREALAIVGVKEEIGFKSLSSKSICFRKDYEAAAERIKLRGGSITVVSLAVEMGKNEHTVRIWLDRNSDFKLRFEITTQTAIDRSERAQKYELAAKVIHSQGKCVTVSAIASSTGFQRKTVYIDLKRNPALEKIFARG